MRRQSLALLLLAACHPSTATPLGPDQPRPTDPGHAAAPDLLASSDLPATLDAPLADDPMGVTIHRLKNGLTIYLSPDHHEPRISAWIAVRAGSRMDPAASTGLAHYLEHMMFKGTRKLGSIDFAKEQPGLDRIAALYGELRAEGGEARRTEILGAIDAETQKTAAFAIPNELDRLYASLGITGVNAFTSDEETVYTCEVPANRLAQWLAVEGERFADPQFRLFWPELEAVYEEKNQTLDSPIDRVFESLALALYPHHPYGTQPTIGSVEHLKSPAYGDMVAYFKGHYVPNNMAVVLAGDVDPATALPLLEQAFGGLTPGPITAAEPGELAPVKGRVEVTVPADGEEAVYLAYRTVGKLAADRDALTAMDALTDNAVAGLLNVDLVLSQKVPEAGSSPNFYNEAGHWMVRATARQGQSLAEVEGLLLAEVAKLKRGEFSQADLDAVMVNQEIAHELALESNDARVSEMAESFTAHEPWEHAVHRLDRLRKVSREDVIRVANQYLGDDFAVVKRVKGKFEAPKITKPKITPIAIDPTRESEFAKAVKAMKTEPIEPAFLAEGKDYQRLTLPAGPLIAVANPRNQLFAVSYRFELGTRRQPLLCHALSLLDRSGAGQLSADALKKKLYAMGTSIETSCGDEATYLSVSGLYDHLNESIVLLDDWLRHPKIDPVVLKALAQNQVSQRKDQMEEPQVVAHALNEYVTRQQASTYLTVPSNQALVAASAKTLAGLLADLPDHRHRTTYFGPGADSTIGARIALGRQHQKVAAPEPRRFRPVKGVQIFLLDKSSAQARLRLTWPRPAIGPEQRALADLYSEYIGGGMGALVFQQIREARGLAYSAWGAYDAGDRPKDQSGALAGLATQADKTAEALTVLVDLLAHLEVEATRLATAKDAIDARVRSTRITPREIGAAVEAWDDLGEPGDPRQREWQLELAATADQLTAFARQATAGGLLVAITGDASRFDLAAIAKLGKVSRVELKKLFAY